MYWVITFVASDDVNNYPRVLLKGAAQQPPFVD